MMMKLLLNSFVKGLPWSYPAWVWKAKEASAIWVISRVFFMGVSGISRLIRYGIARPIGCSNGTSAIGASFLWVFKD